MGKYAIEPVEPLDYNPFSYQPMRETGNEQTSYYFNTHLALDKLCLWYIENNFSLHLMVIYYVARPQWKNQTKILDNLETSKSDWFM